MTEHLDELEWAYGVRTRAEEIRSGVRKTRPIDEVTRNLGFDPEQLRAEVRSAR